ncbi:hypothetical protein D6C81_09772 [Aureobasidium pullulans]|nr:hypothetical protein D6C81_09772 [Aureobasidium pullulans]
MAITCPGEFGFHVSTASVEFPLVMVWGLTDLESDTSTISSVTEGPIRVELPDGRIFELPEGTRFELSAEQRSELPAQLPGVFLAELEAPVPTRRVDEKSDQGPITTARSVVDNLLAIHSRDGP